MVASRSPHTPNLVRIDPLLDCGKTDSHLHSRFTGSQQVFVPAALFRFVFHIAFQGFACRRIQLDDATS